MTECTSMHSEEFSSKDTSNAFSFSINSKMLDKEEEREFKRVSKVVWADLENVNNIDRMENRGRVREAEAAAVRPRGSTSSCQSWT